jgi:hypothetical protein
MRHMENLLKTKIDYQITKTASGTWRRYLGATGHLYSEYVSDARVGSLPLIHITRGRSPETGKIPTARGFIAIGRKALGVIAIGQGAVGIVALGQAAFGVVAVGQLAVSVLFGLAGGGRSRNHRPVCRGCFLFRPVCNRRVELRAVSSWPEPFGNMETLNSIRLHPRLSVLPSRKVVRPRTLSGVRPSPGAATWPVPESVEVPSASPHRTSLRPGTGALRSVAAAPRQVHPWLKN